MIKKIVGKRKAKIIFEHSTGVLSSNPYAVCHPNREGIIATVVLNDGTVIYGGDIKSISLKAEKGKNS